MRVIGMTDDVCGERELELVEPQLTSELFAGGVISSPYLHLTSLFPLHMIQRLSSSIPRVEM